MPGGEVKEEEAWLIIASFESLIEKSAIDTDFILHSITVLFINL